MTAFAVHHSGAANGFLAHHGGHILMLGGPVVLLAGLFAMLEMTRPERSTRGPRVSRWGLALMWAASATIHLAVVAEHFAERAVLGVLFLLLALAQYGYAVAVVHRTTRRLLLVGLVANLSVVLLWTYTRTVAVPLGLGPREPVGVVDLAATALELGSAVLTWLILPRAGLPAGAADPASRTPPRGVHGDRDSSTCEDRVTPARG